MEWCSKSNASGKSIKSMDEKRRDNLSSRYHNNNAKNDLLYLFIQYAWDDRDGPCSDDENIKFLNWLKSTKIDLNNEDWNFPSESDNSIRNEIDGASSDKNISLNTQDSSVEITYARVAYSLRKVLAVLVDYNDDDVNTDASGQTFLHIFFEEHLKKTENFTEDQIIRMQRLVEGLMKISAPFYVNDAQGKTPLHIAATCKNQRIIEIIASCLIDVDARDEFGDTALHIVVDNCVTEELEHREEYLDVVGTLIAKGADPNGKNNEGLTPVHLAAENFHIEILRLLADNDANFDERTNAHELPLHFACKSLTKLSNLRKMVETIDFVIGKCRIVEALDGKGCAPLHHAAGFATVEVVERLIELGAKVDCRNEQLRQTPLHLALEVDRLDNAKALIKAGADIDAEAADGSVPAFVAAAKGSVESLRLLIAEGVDLARREPHSGFTLLHFTAGHEEKFNLVIEKAALGANDPGSCGVTPLCLAALSHNVAAVKILAGLGANVNFQSDESQLSPLHIAALEKNAEIVEILLSNGADVHSPGGIERMTPLHFAVIESLQWTLGRYPEWVKGPTFIDKLAPLFRSSEPRQSAVNVVNTLLSWGAIPNITDASGKCPIHFSAMTDSDGDVTSALVRGGSLMNMQDNEARLPLHYAFANETSGSMLCLLSFGANINEPDTVRLVEDSGEAVKTAVLEQAFKMQFLGLPIARGYEEMLQREQQRFEHLLTPCRDQLKVLKDVVIGDGRSFYEYLHMGSKRQYLLMQQCNDFYADYRPLFPLFDRFIKGDCLEAEIRKFYLEFARIAWYDLTDMHLPDVCVERILSHLNNRNLAILVEPEQSVKKTELTANERVVFEFKLGE